MSESNHGSFCCLSWVKNRASSPHLENPTHSKRAYSENGAGNPAALFWKVKEKLLNWRRAHLRLLAKKTFAPWCLDFSWAGTTRIHEGTWHKRCGFSELGGMGAEICLITAVTLQTRLCHSNLFLLRSLNEASLNNLSCFHQRQRIKTKTKSEGFCLF